MEENKKQLKKLTTFNEDNNLAIFDELQELNENIKAVSKDIKASKIDEIEVNNLSDINSQDVDLKPVADAIQALRGDVDGVLDTIKNTEQLNLSGIEKLLSTIANKKDTPQKDITIKEIDIIATTLDSILFAVQTTASKEALKPEKKGKAEKVVPELKNIAEVLDVINNNLIETPDFDYERLGKMLKKISSGSGGTDSTSIIEAINNGSTSDANNSTTTPLLADAIFTGTSTDILAYSAIAILVHTDKESATDGLEVQFSCTGDSWHSGEAYTISAGSTKFFTPPAQAQFYRIKYTNGGTDQTAFHLHSTLKRNPIKWSSHNIEEPIKDQDDAELTKAVITGKKTDGTYDNVHLTNGSNMKVSIEEYESGVDSPFYLKVAKGLVDGHSIVNKFGQNTALNSSTYEDVWDGGGVYSYPADGTAPITNVESTSASDTTDLEVQGLDIDGTLVVQTVTLTGTTLVTLPTPLWRVFRMKNVGAAEYVGIITADNAGTTITYAIIQIGNNQTLMALYTVPLGKKGYLLQGTNMLIGTNRTYTVDGRMTMRQYGGVHQLKKTFGLSADGSSYIVVESPLPGGMPARTDIRVSAKSSATGGINTTFAILLVSEA